MLVANKRTLVANWPPHGRFAIWELLPLVGSLGLGGILRLWGLSCHGFDNLYYAPAVQSMASSWHNFWYASFDSAGFLAIGKPPLAFWLQALASRLLGFGPLATHLPQVLAGLSTIALVYVLGRRLGGRFVAGCASMIVAVSPASVAADRSNLADSWLTLLLVLSALLLLSACDTGKLTRLLLAAFFAGLAFLAKFMAALVVVPALVLAFLCRAPIPIPRRLAHLLFAALVFCMVALSWPLFVEMTPQGSRPFVAETQDSSVLELAFGLQGVGRVLKSEAPDEHEPVGEAGLARGMTPGPRGRPSEGVLTGHGGRPGPLRLANRDMAGHVSWFLPLVLPGVPALFCVAWRRAGRLGATADLVLWTAWCVVVATVFSLARTFIHPYYLSLLAPAVALLAALVLAELRAALDAGGRRVVLPVIGLGITIAWHLRVLAFVPTLAGRLALPLAALAALTLLGLGFARRRALRQRVGGLALVLALFLPSLWAATPALAPLGRMVPIADPALIAAKAALDESAAGDESLSSLADFLEREREGERFLVAARDIHAAGPLMLETGEAVMAFGGYYGTENAISLESFVGLVESGALRFVLLSGEGGGNAIESWVRAHGARVPKELWQAREALSSRESGAAFMWGPTDEIVGRLFASDDTVLYDCSRQTG